MKNPLVALIVGILIGVGGLYFFLPYYPLTLGGGSAQVSSAGAGDGAERASAGETLRRVRNRGFVQCGVSQGLPGFSSPDERGNWSGIDVDFCRALAAAVFGAVPGLHETGDAAPADCLHHLLEARFKGSGLAGETQRIGGAAGQKTLDEIGQVRTRYGRCPGGLREVTLQSRLFNHFTRRRDPKATPRQFFAKIGHNPAFGVEHETDKSVLAAALAGDDAAALGALTGCVRLLHQPRPFPPRLPLRPRLQPRDPPR